MEPKKLPGQMRRKITHLQLLLCTQLSSAIIRKHTFEHHIPLLTSCKQEHTPASHTLALSSSTSVLTYAALHHHISIADSRERACHKVQRIVPEPLLHHGHTAG